MGKTRNIGSYMYHKLSFKVLWRTRAIQVYAANVKQAGYPVLIQARLLGYSTSRQALEYIQC